MNEDIATSRFPAHRTVVTERNIDTVRSILPDDQRALIRIGCLTWRMPPDVDTWVEPCGVTMTYWPEGARGALHCDGTADGSEWGTWRGDELWLDDGFAADVNGRILRVILGEQPPGHDDTPHPDQHPYYGADHG